jgi:hypothetical protein
MKALIAKAGQPLGVIRRTRYSELTMLDPFTRRRLIRFIETFRSSSGQLPTLKDLESNGFGSDHVKQALKEKVIEEFYVTLTSGTVVKGYKLGSSA